MPRPADRPARATRIVATIGPATETPAVVRRMIREGTDVFRFNLSHGTHEEHARRLEVVRAAETSAGRPVAVLFDLQGPKLRTVEAEAGEAIVLRTGERVRVVFRGARAALRTSRQQIVVRAPDLSGSLGRGDSILLDDGKLRLSVERRAADVLEARVIRGGPLKDRAGVNIPGRVRGLSVPTAKDALDARFAVASGADFVALSFVQTAQDVRRARQLLERLAGDRPRPHLIAKIEKPTALENLDAILEEVEGVMVARGDLGVELSLEKVPTWQKEILRRARRRGVFTITATQMLESMIRSPVPTRAEVSDAANAVLDGTDALMLSAESAIGEYPVEAVAMLARAAGEADRRWLGRDAADVDLEARRILPEETSLARDPAHAVVHAAVQMAVDARARWIVAFTLSGRTARLLSRYRPPVPILALTPHPETRRRLCLGWNTWSLELPRAGTVDEMMREGLARIRAERGPRTGDRVVLAAGTLDLPEAAHLLRLASL